MRHPNHRLVKIHHTYTVDEMAEMLRVHRNSVRSWLRKGLEPIDEQRPLLVLGSVLVEFLQARRAARKVRCLPGQMYCLGCREPRAPAGNQAFYRPITPTSGSLNGRCSHCDSRMFRRVNLAKLPQIAGDLRVSMTNAQQHIVEGHDLSLNCDFKQVAPDHD